MIVEHIELGMSHVGLGPMSEVALLMLFANEHSRHLVEGTGVRPDEIRDGQGRRLYPAYFRTRLCVPPSARLSSFGLWDRVDVGVHVKAFGKTLLESEYVLGREGEIPTRVEAWDKTKHPTMEAQSVFVLDAGEGENHKRQVSAPARQLIAPLEPMPVPPAAIERAKQIRRQGFGVRDEFSADGEHSTVRYPVAMMRDLQPGHGMVFAKFSEILHQAEREVLARLDGVANLSQDALHFLEVVDREIYYFGNCFGHDTLALHVRGNIEACAPTFHGEDHQVTSGAIFNFETTAYRDRTSDLLAIAKAKYVLVVPARSQELLLDVERMMSRRTRRTREP